MTTVRAKRNSKVPNRFSSDSARIETSGANGETIIDYIDNSTSTTHTLAPISKAIKLKPVIREPLKVKLPKLKKHIDQQNQQQQQQQQPQKPQQQQKASKEKDISIESSEVKIHKIKLPSLNKKHKAPVASKNDPSSRESTTKVNSKGSHKQEQPTGTSNGLTSSPSTTTTTTISPSLSSSHVDSKLPATTITTTTTTTITTSIKKIDTTTASNNTTTTTSNSKTSASNHAKKSSSKRTKLNSPDFDDPDSRMQIVVSPKGEHQASSTGIRCPCGVEDDLGVMVECESCSTWQHGHCINVGSEDDAYEGYICAFCTSPKGGVYESLRQLTVNDKYQSRFKILESLIKQKGSQCNESNSVDIPKFSNSELSNAISELRRVLGSLKVKIRLLLSEGYEQELRIWQNNVWSLSLLNNPVDDTQIYFVDRCKRNLRMHVHNIMKRMKTRTRLIELAISENEKENKDESSRGIDKLRELNMEVLEEVHVLESKFHDYVSKDRSLNGSQQLHHMEY